MLCLDVFKIMSSVNFLFICYKRFPFVSFFLSFFSFFFFSCFLSFSFLFFFWYYFLSPNCKCVDLWLEKATKAKIKGMGIIRNINDIVPFYYEFKIDSGEKFEHWKKRFLASTILLNSDFFKNYGPEYNIFESLQDFNMA